MGPATVRSGCDFGEQLGIVVATLPTRTPTGWQGVIYEATYSGRLYACVVATHHLKMKRGREAVAEFQARLPDVEQATKERLNAANSEMDEGRRRGADRIIVPLTL